MIKDPYLYDGTNVLKNSLSIKDEKILDQVENDLVYISTNNLKRSDFQFNDIRDVMIIHKSLFSSLYDWAGSVRTIDIYKGQPILDGKSIDYVFVSYIDIALKELNDEFIKIDWENLSIDRKIKTICYFVSETWHIHPFREGNTRTAAMMLYFLLKKAGLHVNIEFLTKNGKYFRNSLVLASLYTASKENYLFEIVSDCVSYKNLNNNKYLSIDGLEVKKYSYTNHSIKKMETINKPEDWIKNDK